MIARSDVLTNPYFAGQVRRYHTWPVLQQQTVGEHTWQVLRIYDTVWGPIPPHVTRFILWHDAGELVTGDVPFPMKQRNPALREAMAAADELALQGMRAPKCSWLTTVEQLRAKAADLCEMWQFGLVERALGNTLAQPIIDDISEALQQLLAERIEDWAAMRNYRIIVEEKFPCIVSK